MKKILFIISLLMIFIAGEAQTLADIFNPLRHTYLEMQIDKSGKILSKRYIESGPPFDLRNDVYNLHSNLCGKNHFEAVLDYKGFEEGLIAVRLNKKWGYVDKNCKIVIKPQFDHAYNFSEGLAVIEINKKEGYIDKIGKVVINPQFDRAWSFENGIAKVRKRVPTLPAILRPKVWVEM